jgi:zinc transporter 5/7
MTSLALSPFAIAQMWISEIWDDVVSQFPYMVIVAILFTVHFYLENSAQAKLDAHRVAQVSSLTMFCGALVLTFLWIAPIDHGLVHHMSAGVAMSVIFFFFATPILNRAASTRNKDGSALPMYMDEGRLRPSERIKEVISKILSSRDSRNIFYFLCLNLSFTFVEFLYGFWSNSLGLISDGFHMLFDCTALVLGLYAAVASQWKSNKVFSYGYGRMETLSGFINGLFLLTIAFYVFMEAVDRLVDPPHIDTNRLLIVSVGGLVVNLVGIVAFSDAHAHAHGGHCSHSHSNAPSHGHQHSHSHVDKHSHHHHHHHSTDGSHPNANMQGIFLHVLADTLGSVAVIISSLLIQQFGWHVADPICSLFLSGLIFLSVIPLVRESMKTLLLVPSDFPGLQKCLEKIHHIEGVVHYSHAHFWQLSSSALVGTINVQVTQSCNEQKIIHAVGALLKEYGVNNLAIQVEKEPFCSSGIANSTRQHSGTSLDITPPEIYVDYGPVTSGNIV